MPNFATEHIHSSACIAADNSGRDRLKLIDRLWSLCFIAVNFSNKCSKLWSFCACVARRLLLTETSRCSSDSVCWKQAVSSRTNFHRGSVYELTTSQHSCPYVLILWIS